MENEWDFELFNSGKVLFQDLNIEDVVSLISQETDSLPEENNSHHMRSRRKTKSNTESLDWPMGFSRIFLDNNGYGFCHKKYQVNDKNGSQASIIPDSTTRPQRDIFGSIVAVGT